MALLTANDLLLARPGAAELRFPDIHIKAGDRVALRGPSGSGKTTWLAILAGLLSPTQGTVMLDGVDMYTLRPSARDRMRAENFGFVFQSFHLLPALSARENIALAAYGKDNDVDRIVYKLDLSGKAHRLPHSLSQGEQQRVAIARALVRRPGIIFADEPTSALDDINATRVMDLLSAEAEQVNAALIVATHDTRISGYFSDGIALGGERA